MKILIEEKIISDALRGFYHLLHGRPVDEAITNAYKALNAEVAPVGPYSKEGCGS